MAALIRQVCQTVRPLTRAVLVSSRKMSSKDDITPANAYEKIDKEVRTSSEAFYQQLSGKKAVDAEDVPQRLGVLANDQRYEILETLRGNPDPFDACVKKQEDSLMGHFETPILVPSTSGERLIGCVCEEDASEVIWMLLYSGEKKKCSCGNWFQIHDLEGAVDH